MTSIDTSKKGKVHILITLLVMVYIFVQSALPGEVSGAESRIVVSFITWLADITGITAISELDTVLLTLIVRKLAHFTEYMVLGGSLMVNAQDWYQSQKSTDGWIIGWGKKRRASFEKHFGIAHDTGGQPKDCKIRPLWWLVFAAWKIGALYSMTDEIHQVYVPERVGAAGDVCIDSAGVFCGALLVHIWWLQRNKNISQAQKYKK